MRLLGVRWSHLLLKLQSWQREAPGLGSSSWVWLASALPLRSSHRGPPPENYLDTTVSILSTVCMADGCGLCLADLWLRLCHVV